MPNVVELNIPHDSAEREAQRLRVRGVGRVSDEPRALLVLLTKIPSDDDLRRMHEFLQGWR